MYRYVMIVRHAMPILLPEQPAGSRPLANEGKARAALLAQTIAPFAPDLVIASSERKARETGDIIAASLDLERSTVDGLHEQGGDTVPFIDDPSEFRQTVRRHFELSGRAVLGTESSRDASRRFRTALDLVGDRFPAARLPLIVSHGRIIASFLGDLTGDDLWAIWNELRLPDLIRVDLEARRFEKPR